MKEVAPRNAVLNWPDVRDEVRKSGSLLGLTHDPDIFSFFFSQEIPAMKLVELPVEELKARYAQYLIERED